MTVAPLPELFQQVAPGYQEPDPYDAPALRWGILGPGGIARAFARDVPAGSSQQVVAVGSRNIERAQQFASESGIDPDRAYGSYEELVADPDIDAVYIATPHSRHKDDALLALRAGKPVLVEKPFALTEAEAQEVFDEAERQGLFAMEAMWSRHLPHYHFIREAVAAGKLGPLRSAYADHGQSLRHVARLVEPELGGGALLDLGVYPIHFEQMLFGAPQSIWSMSRLSEKGVDLSDVVVSTYPEGTAVATTSMDALTPTAGLVSFEGGSIAMPETFYRGGEVKLEVHDLDPATQSIHSTQTATWDASVSGGFQYEAAEAARRIAAGDLESPAVPWSATLDVARTMDQVLQNAGYIGR